MSPPLTTPTSSPLKRFTQPPKKGSYRISTFWESTFWEEDGYYQHNEHLVVTKTLDGEVFDPPLVLRTGSYYLCERVEQRQMCNDDDSIPRATVAILRTLHPTDQRNVRIELWPHSTSAFSKVENAMEIIALAATGLSQ